MGMGDSIDKFTGSVHEEINGDYAARGNQLAGFAYNGIAHKHNQFPSFSLFVTT